MSSRDGDEAFSDAVFGVYESEVIANVFSLKIQLNSLKIECKLEPEAVKHEADCFTVSCTGKSIGFALYLSSSWGNNTFCSKTMERSLFIHSESTHVVNTTA